MIDPADLTVRGSSSIRSNEADPTIAVADVKDLVEGQGATFVATVNDECTHLITTEKDVEKKSAKCECQWPCLLVWRHLNISFASITLYF